ncbi:MAG TPA: aldolase [Candidatus Sulfotelmatobacter sp.]
MAESTAQKLSIGADGAYELAPFREGLSAHPDPIGCDFNLPLKALYYPLGFAVEISTNCPAVLAAAEQNWKSFYKAFSAPPVQVRIAVTEGQATDCPPPPTCRGQRNLVMFVAGPYDFAVCDLTTGFASLWLSASTVENSAYLRYHFLDSTVLLLIEALYLTPIHAACVAFQDRGFLLCGDSGAGKSSFSFACARRGWTFVSDDANFLIRDRKQRIVVGNPYHVHFRESATELFPELKSHCLTQRINGEMAIELATANLPEIITSSQSPIDFIVFLSRGTSGPASLRPFSKERALVYLEQVICYGDQHLRDAQKSSLHALLRAEILELRYTELNSAVECLEALVGARGAAIQEDII